MSLNSRLLNRRTVWPVFLAFSILLILVVSVLPPPYRSSEVLIAAVGGLWALAFYLHQRHAEDARFMKELLADFNRRYDDLNAELQLALWSQGESGEEKKLKFIDYFNLCAEEWLFWKAGYVYEELWTAWVNGMKQYEKDPRVAALPRRERQSNSYCGFELPTE